MQMQMEFQMREYAEKTKAHYEKIIADKTFLIQETMKRNKELMEKIKLLENIV
jgi:hypothetical protein